MPWDDSWDEYRPYPCAMCAFRASECDIRAGRTLLAPSSPLVIGGFRIRALGAPPAKTSLVDLRAWDERLVPRNSVCLDDHQRPRLPRVRIERIRRRVLLADHRERCSGGPQAWLC